MFVLHMNTHHLHDWYLKRSEEGMGSPGTEPAHGYEPLMWVLAIKPGLCQTKPLSYSLTLYRDNIIFSPCHPTQGFFV